MKTISLAALALIVLLTGCRQSPRVHTCSGAVWATTYAITYTADRNLDDSIMAVVKQVENSLSPFVEQSIISKINRGESEKVDSMVRHIFRASQRINRLSHGAFDPTVAPLVNLWGFGYDNASTPPTAAQIDSALALVGIDRCSLSGDSLVKPNALTQFNFSAITKGYGCDMIGKMLRRNGSTDYMIEIGGEIALSGRNPKGELWHIQIDAPVEGTDHQQLTVVELTDCGIATSGNYRNFHAGADGSRTWHTINPQTGHPAITSTLSVIVIAPDCMTADALATACMAMPSAEAIAMIEALEGVEAMLVEAGQGDAYVIIESSGFPKFSTVSQRSANGA